MVFARKRFGQHFLHEAAVIERIVECVRPRPGEAIVEIGPGRGALTAPLLAAAGKLDVIEIDRDLARALRERFGPDSGLHVHPVDALQVDFRTLCPSGGKLRIVGNLPYNISTPLIFHLLEQLAIIEDMHFMLQREVIERAAAPPGSKVYGRLSVMVQARCRVERLFIVRPGAFAPPPRVESAFARLTPGATLEPPVREWAAFSRVVKDAFGQRRKTLGNALAGVLTPDDIRASGVDPGLRAERISPGGFARLANRLAERAKR